MTTTSEAELFRALPGWQRYGNRIEKTSTSTTSVLRHGSSAGWPMTLPLPVARLPSTSAVIA